MKNLKGITWDHPRGFNSIVASSNLYHAHNSLVNIEWYTRSLKEFGDQPISELVEKFDLLMIDHPFVGEAHKYNLLVPLETMLPSSLLNKHESLHIGHSYPSYTYEKSQYALPIDASAQFTAFNSQMISKASIPTTWEDYLDQLKDSKFKNSVLWPLCPTDLWCSLLTVCAQIDGGDFFEQGFKREIVFQGIEHLKIHTSGLNPICWDSNPINALEQMKQNNFAYSPLLFGYAHYSNKSTSIQFTNPIAFNPDYPLTLLGGVGIAVSSYSPHREVLTEFLTFLFQHSSIDAYFLAGGQPSLKEVWKNNAYNESTHDFFLNTSKSMENTYIRPKKPGFHRFQKEASELFHAQYRSVSTKNMVSLLANLYTKHVHD